MTTKPITALIKGLSDLDYSPEKIATEAAEALAKGTHHDNRLPAIDAAPTDALVKRIEDAGKAWAMAKADAKAKEEADDFDGDDNGDQGEGEDGKPDDDDDDKDNEAMNKGASGADVEMSPDLASQVIADAINDALGPRLAKAFASIAKRIEAVADRVEAVGDQAQKNAETQVAIAKGASARSAVTATVDPVLVDRLDRMEKALSGALEKVEKVLREPAGGFRGIIDMNLVEIPAPGDANNPDAPIAKGTTEVAAQVTKALLARQAEAKRKGDDGTVQAMHKAIQTINMFPNQAPAVAADVGITV